MRKPKNINDPSEQEYTIAEYTGEYGDELQPLAKRLGAAGAAADDVQLRTLYSYLRYKENFVLENTLSYTMRLPPLMMSLEDDLAAYRYIEACLAFHFEKWKEALQCILIRNRVCNKDKEYLAALETAARSMLSGNELDEAFAIIERFYSPEIIGRVRRVFNWSDCAGGLMSYCDKVREAADAYEIYRSVRHALKDRQAGSNFLIQLIDLLCCIRVMIV